LVTSGSGKWEEMGGTGMEVVCVCFAVVLSLFVGAVSFSKRRFTGRLTGLGGLLH
jgi:hypothetical protein